MNHCSVEPIIVRPVLLASKELLCGSGGTSACDLLQPCISSFCPRGIALRPFSITRRRVITLSRRLRTWWSLSSYVWSPHFPRYPQLRCESTSLWSWSKSEVIEFKVTLFLFVPKISLPSSLAPQTSLPLMPFAANHHPDKRTRDGAMLGFTVLCVGMVIAKLPLVWLLLPGAKRTVGEIVETPLMDSCDSPRDPTCGCMQRFFFNQGHSSSKCACSTAHLLSVHHSPQGAAALSSLGTGCSWVSPPGSAMR